LDLDRIEIRSLRVVATHGALPEERGRAQPFELDIDVLVPSGSGRSDRLVDTVDYGQVLTRAVEVVTGTSFMLLEALADAVAEALLNLDPRAMTVEVAVRKLRPTVPHDVSSAGIRVARRRAEDAGTGR